jgi:hypothetical protein
MKRKSDILDCIKAVVQKEIAHLRATTTLKSFIIQADNGEAKSKSITDYLATVGGSLCTCCAYTPETMAMIERLWGTIHNMASAMMISNIMAEPFWEYAQKYAALIYNSVQHQG